MSCINKKENYSCLQELVETIIKLQNCSENCELECGGCTKPFLGPTPTIVCFNTRPLHLFKCFDGSEWTLPYTYNGIPGVSSVFRAECLDGCCVTCRILIPNPDTTNTTNPYIATESYFTINLDCVGAISCRPDVVVPNL